MTPPWRFASEKFGGLALFLFANSFERAVFRGTISNKRRKFYFAGDRIGCFKFSFERQSSRVAPHIADEKLHWTRERHGVSLIASPLCAGRLGTPPNFGLRIRHRQTAFSIVLCIKAQETVLLVSKNNLDLPTASHVRRLCPGQDEGECVYGHYQNYCARCFHVFF